VASLPEAIAILQSAFFIAKILIISKK